MVGVPDEEFGQRLRAYVVLEPGAQLERGPSSRSTCARNLARYKVPREIVFVDELPRNSTGKILKRDLIDSSH